MNSTTRTMLIGTSVLPPPKIVTDPGVYVYVPYRTTASASTAYDSILALDTTTGSVTSTITSIGTTAVNVRLIRCGVHLIQIHITGGVGNYSIFNLVTGAETQPITAFGYSGIGYDAGKFADDKFAVMYMSSEDIRIATYLVSSSGTLSLISDMFVATMSNFQNGYSSPQFGFQITMDSNAVLSSYSGYLGLSCVYSYFGGSTVTYYAVVSLNSAGTSVSVASSFTNGNNFSRPVGATGDNGYCLVGTMDMSSAYKFTGTSMGSATSAGGNSYNNNTPAAIHGSSGEFMINTYSNTINKITLSSVATSLNLTSSPNFGITIQTTKGGCTLVYNDASASNTIIYKNYSHATGTWSADLSIGGYSTGIVNGSNQSVRKVNNY